LEPPEIHYCCESIPKNFISLGAAGMSFIDAPDVTKCLKTSQSFPLISGKESPNFHLNIKYQLNRSIKSGIHLDQLTNSTRRTRITAIFLTNSLRNQVKLQIYSYFKIYHQN